MFTSERDALSKWCPFAGADGANRPGGQSASAEDTDRRFCCLGKDCMAWREFHLSHVKTVMGGASVDTHGYCGLAGLPDLGDTI